MLNKAFVSPIALALGLALTGAAAAQTMVGDQNISEADLPRVQEHCDVLLADEAVATAPTTNDETASTDSSTDVDENAPDAADGSDTATEPGDLNFLAITLEDCRAAGLVE